MRILNRKFKALEFYSRIIVTSQCANKILRFPTPSSYVYIKVNAQPYCGLVFFFQHLLKDSFTRQIYQFYFAIPFLGLLTTQNAFSRDIETLQVCDFAPQNRSRKWLLTLPVPAPSLFSSRSKVGFCRTKFLSSMVQFFKKSFNKLFIFHWKFEAANIL